MIQNSYKECNKGKLYLIPTPIGNIEDITLRAISILKSIDVIFAEDTRVTNILLKKYDIKKKIYSCHKYSEEKNKENIVSLLEKNMDIAYVSDRGTPLISDPGSVIVKYAIKKGYSVISLPGASALLPALNMSGLSNDRFLFYGFLDSKKSERINELKKLCSIKYTMIFYEAPHRIKDTLSDMIDVLGNRNIAVCREISKLYEEVFRGSILEAVEYYKEFKGEFVIIVEGNNTQEEELDYIAKVKELIAKGHKPSSAIKEIAVIYGISKNELYEKCKEEIL